MVPTPGLEVPDEEFVFRCHAPTTQRGSQKRGSSYVPATRAIRCRGKKARLKAVELSRRPGGRAEQPGLFDAPLAKEVVQVQFNGVKCPLKNHLLSRINLYLRDAVTLEHTKSAFRPV